MDDGSHHEQSAEPGVRPELCPHSAGRLAAYLERRCAGNRLDGVVAAGRLLFRVWQSTIRWGEVPETKSSAPRCAGSRRSARCGGTLDYVTAWFIKAGEYVQTGPSPYRLRCHQLDHAGRAGGATLADYCSTANQVGRSPLHTAPSPGAQTRVAKPMCMWSSSGLDRSGRHVRVDKRLFSYPDIKGEPEETRACRAIALSVRRRRAGRSPSDGARGKPPDQRVGKTDYRLYSLSTAATYIFEAEDRAALLAAEPDAAPFLRPFVGAREYLHSEAGDGYLALA